MSAPATESSSVDKQAVLKNISDGKKAERKLGLMLIAPAAFMMLAVTGIVSSALPWISNIGRSSCEAIFR